MKSKKTQVSNLLILMGVILFLGAILFFLSNCYEEKYAENVTQQILPVVQDKMKENRHTTEPIKATEKFDILPCESMLEIEIDGQKYIGCLSIPKLNLDLPIISKWSYDRLKIAPCRQYGSVKGNNLVIAAHNYRSHFGTLGLLEPNDIIRFSDMNGNVYTYKVIMIGVISPDNIEYIRENKWDLILYTCTSGGRKRIMVGANKYSNGVTLMR